MKKGEIKQFVKVGWRKKREVKTLIESYYMYRWDNRDNKDRVSQKVYMNITKTHMSYILKRVVDGLEVGLPERMGALRISGRKQRVKIRPDGKVGGLAPNWEETKKLWKKNPEAKAEGKIVSCLNAETEGIIFRVQWDKYEAYVQHREIYSFLLCRGGRIITREAIKKNKGAPYSVF